MNRVCETLGIRCPVVQAPMNWITSPELVAAVSAAGGLGTFGFGGGSPRKRATHDETNADLRAAIRKVRAATSAPFAVNLLTRAADRRGYAGDTLRIIREEGVPVAVLVGRDFAEDDVAPLKEAGVKVVARELEPTVEGARRLEELGADVIVATGCDEGGVMPMSATGTMAMVALMADAVDVPVLAAGGIIDGRFARAAAVLGAEGAFVGTRFILSEECRAARAAKDALLATPQDDYAVITVRGGTGRWRSTPTATVMAAVEGNRAGNLSPDQGDYFASEMEGRLDLGVNTGDSVTSLIRGIEPCAAIVADIARGFDPAVGNGEL